MVSRSTKLKVKIVRDAKPATYHFTDYFKGFEEVEAVKRIFGERTRDVLGNLMIEFNSMRRGYMGVDDTNGNLMVNTRYLKEGDIIDIYLDVIHELVHVRQFLDGKKLFDSCYEYIDRPTEIEAFRHTVEEARRLGLSDERIFDYLRTEWLSDQEHKRLASSMNVKCPR